MSSILSQEEIAALLHGLPAAGGDGAPPAGTAAPADAGARLDALAARCARLCAASMEEQRGRLLVLTPLPVRYRPFGVVADSIREASCCCAVRQAGLEEPALLVLDRDFVFSLLDEFFGAGGFARPGQRPLTALETMLARKFAERFLAAFDLAGKPSSWHPCCGRSLSLPRLALLTPDGQPVWHLAFRALLGGRAGALHLCLPEDFPARLAAGPALADAGREKDIPDTAGASGMT